MTYLRAILIVLLGLTTGSAAAQTEAGPAPVYRYLFVIDTSSGMKRNEELLPTIVHDMVYDGIGGKMQPGDIYGVWTFSEDVNTAFLPPLVWRPDLAIKQALSVDLQIRDLHYKGKSDPAVVIKALAPVISRAKDLTVVMLTDGSGVMFGTPYDLQITSIYRQYYHDMSRSRRPFITSLLTRDGKWMAWSVNAAGNNPGVPVLPPRPKPLEEVKAVPTPKVEEKAKIPQSPPKKPVESIIVKGPIKAKPTPPVEQSKKMAIPTPAPKVASEPAKPAMKPLETVKVERKPKAAPVNPPGEIVNTSASAKPVQMAAKTENPPVTAPAIPTPPKPVTQSTKPLSLPSNVENSKPAKSMAIQGAKAVEYHPPAPTPVKPAVEATPPTKPPVTTAKNNPVSPEPVPVAKPEPVKTPLKPEPPTPAPKPLEPAAQLAQTAVVTPPAPGTSWGKVTLGTLFLLAAVLTLWLYTSKSRTAPSGSVISRSLDKEKRS